MSQGPKQMTTWLTKRKGGSGFPSTPKTDEPISMTEGYSVMQLAWATHPDYLSYFLGRQSIKAVGSCLYQWSTGKFFMMKVRDEPTRYSTPGQLWVDPMGKPSYPEPTPTEKILAKWDKSLTTAIKKRRAFVAKEIKAGKKKVRGISTRNYDLNKNATFVAAIDDDGLCDHQLHATITRQTITSSTMVFKRGLAMSAASMSKDPQTMATAAFYTLALDAWESGKSEVVK